MDSYYITVISQFDWSIRGRYFPLLTVPIATPVIALDYKRPGSYIINVLIIAIPRGRAIIYIYFLKCTFFYLG